MLNGRMEPVGTVEVITADIIILFLWQLTALFSFSSMCTVGEKSYVCYKFYQTVIVILSLEE